MCACVCVCVCVCVCACVCAFVCACGHFPCATDLICPLAHVRARVSSSLRLNWTSLGVPDFVDRCNAGISKFENILFHVKKNESDIGDILAR